MTEFAEFLDSRRITREAYARFCGISSNTIRRRARGELTTPREVMALLRSAPEKIAKAIRESERDKV